MKRKRDHKGTKYLACLLLLLFVGCGSDQNETVPVWTYATETECDETKDAVTTSEVVVIHICGEVSIPGVYELPKGSRIQDAVLAAGGMTERAAESYLNLARILVDGEQILVPDQEMAATAEQVVLEKTSGKVNLNTAEVGQLETLPGIGRAKAQAIVNYRDEIGSFSKIEQIMEVPGIGAAVFKQLQDLIDV